MERIIEPPRGYLVDWKPAYGAALYQIEGVQIVTKLGYLNGNPIWQAKATPILGTGDISSTLVSLGYNVYPTVSDAIEDHIITTIATRLQCVTYGLQSHHAQEIADVLNLAHQWFAAHPEKHDDREATTADPAQG